MQAASTSLLPPKPPTRSMPRTTRARIAVFASCSSAAVGPVRSKAFNSSSAAPSTFSNSPPGRAVSTMLNWPAISRESLLAVALVASWSR